jgi:single-strand DNA-binding protein
LTRSIHTTKKETRASMAEETRLTIVGNLTRDPELRLVGDDEVPVARFAVASTPRIFKNNEWTDGDPLFMECSAWRKLAENVTESFTKGARVIVVGTLKQRSYETDDGQKRTVTEMTVEEVGASVRYATLAIERNAKGGGGGSRVQGDPEWDGAKKAAPAKAAKAAPAKAAAAKAAPAAEPAGDSFDDL